MHTTRREMALAVILAAQTQAAGLMKRMMAIALAACLMIVAATAWGYWSADSAAGGNAAAAATTVNQGATPTGNAVGTTVTVSWAATTLANGQAVGGYLVKRYDSGTDVVQTILSALHRHDHRPVVHREQRACGVVEVHRHPHDRHELGRPGKLAERHRHGDPVRHHSAGQRHHPVQRHRRRLQVRPPRSTTAARPSGSFTLTNAVTDAGSGPASSQTATLGDTPTNWTHTGSTVSTPRGRPLRLQRVQLDRGRDQLTHRGRDRARRRRQHRRHEPDVRQRLDRPERGHDQLPRRLPARPLRPGHVHHRHRWRLGHRHQPAPATVRSADKRHLWQLHGRLQQPRSGQPDLDLHRQRGGGRQLLHVPLRRHRPGRQPAHRHQRERVQDRLQRRRRQHHRHPQPLAPRRERHRRRHRHVHRQPTAPRITARAGELGHHLDLQGRHRQRDHHRRTGSPRPTAGRAIYTASVTPSSADYSVEATCTQAARSPAT